MNKLAFVAVASIIIFKTSVSMPDNHNSAIYKEIENVLIEGFKIKAKQINSMAPKMLSNNIQLDKVTVGPGARVNYHYTFVNYISTMIDKEYLLDLEKEIKTKVCNSKEMKPSLQLDGVYVYSYYSSDNIRLIDIKVNRQDCGYNWRVPMLKKQ